MQENQGEWEILKLLLPPGWEEAARELGAFSRARFTKSPGELLRLLLFHAVNDGGLRTTAAEARTAGIASMSPVALFKRLRTSGAWLEWIAAGLCRELRCQTQVPEGLRFRAIDSTTLAKPGTRGTAWRLHYMLDLWTMACDWQELTDASGGEAIGRAPIAPGDVILGDRNFSHLSDLQHAVARSAHVLVRLRWKHAAMRDSRGRPFRVLDAVKDLRVDEVGSWDVQFVTPKGTPGVSGRVVVVRLPAPLAARAQARAERTARRKGKTLHPNTLVAAQFVMIFTTLPPEIFGDAAALEAFRFRWQIEIAFKRHKQLLKLGKTPHKMEETGRAWISAKLVVALLLEKLYRNSGSFSPWGYRIEPQPAAPR